MAARRHYCSSLWADIQPELLGLVRRRLPSLADRVRVGAVCRSWRRGARLEPVSPPFPWLSLPDGTFLSVPDGEVHCLPAEPPPGDVSRCHCSVGSWLFLENSSFTTPERTLSLTNPFSNDVVLPLPDADTVWRHEPVDEYDHARRPILYKLVALTPMDDLSPDSLLAALITDCAYESVISICQSSAAAAFRVPGHERICDVALVGGKLYALSPRKLFVLDVDSSCGAGEPRIPPMRCIANAVDNPGTLQNTIAGESYTCAYWNYLVESSGKLWHVRRLVGRLSDLPKEDWMEHSRTFSFEVFEANLSNDGSCVQWRRVSSLGELALFVGPDSKSIHASERGAQADCIYFMCDYDWSRDWRDPLRDCGVFSMRNGTITPLLPETTVVRWKSNSTCTCGHKSVVRPGGVRKGRAKDKVYSARPAWFFHC